MVRGNVCRLDISLVYLSFTRQGGVSKGGYFEELKEEFENERRQTRKLKVFQSCFFVVFFW